MIAKTKRHRPTKTTSRATAHPRVADTAAPFVEHFIELRRRLFRIAISVVVFSGIAYGFEHRLIDALLRPAKGQQFIYTSPGGGVDFLFRVILYAGVALSIPIIVYQTLKYVEPLIERESKHFIIWGSFVSGVLALAGMVFGYYIGLPNALHFLLHQFVTQQIRPLVTIQSYMAFVTVYMLGSALLFQAPLILVFINRIKPLKLGMLLKGERWVILFSFIGAGLMNPSPNILAQLLVAGPLIMMYQVGIGLIWYLNHSGQRPAFVRELLAKDAIAQAERFERFKAGQPLNQLAMPAIIQPEPSVAVLVETFSPTVRPTGHYMADVRRARGDNERA